MIKFLVTAAIVLVCLFILVLVSCLMVWVVMRLLRWLFPRRFGSKAAPVKKPAAKKSPTIRSPARNRRRTRKMRNTDRSSLPGIRSGKCVTAEEAPCSRV